MVTVSTEKPTAKVAMFAEENAPRCVVIALGLTFLVNVPLLILGTVFGDDWAWVWVHHWKGYAALQDYTWQFSHPGYGPIMNLFFWLGGDDDGRIARSIALAFHLTNGWLLWRIFRDGRSAPAFAATVAILYLSAPFLGGLRASSGHDTYDLFIFCYLLSIWLSTRSTVLSFGGAIVSLLGGMMLETLAALEVIRWWYLYRQGYDLRTFVRRVLPFLAVILIVAVSRATWLVSYGDIYAGHNTIKKFALWDLLKQTYHHLAFFVNAMQPVRYVSSLFLADNILVTIALALLAAAIGITRFRADSAQPSRDKAILAALGLVVLGLGIFPYAAIDHSPVWTGLYSRFAVASQFGIFILTALLIDSIRGSAIKAGIFATVVFIFSGMQLQFGKWALFDEQIVNDFQSQLAIEFKTHDSELLFVRFQPRSDEILYLKRCLANYDINVALDVRGERHGSFAYDADCGADEYTEDGKCGVTAFERTPCPPKQQAEFRIHPGIEPFTRFDVVDLAKMALAGSRLDTGTLFVDRNPRSNLLEPTR